MNPEVRKNLGAGPDSSELVALVAAEIRRLAPGQARERSGSSPDEHLTTLLTRVLSDCAIAPEDRPPFLAVYASAVRRVLCEHLPQHGPADPSDGSSAPETILAIDRVLRPLQRVNPGLVTVVECLYFARLTEDEAAGALRSDAEGVRLEWTRARAWLLKELTTAHDAAGRDEVSVANAAWVDAVLRSAFALDPHDRTEFLAQCHAAAPGLRNDVEDLLRLAEHGAPGVELGEISPAFLWSVLSRSGTLGPPESEAQAPEQQASEQAPAAEPRTFAPAPPPSPADVQPDADPEPVVHSATPQQSAEPSRSTSAPPPRFGRFIVRRRVPVAVGVVLVTAAAAVLPAALARRDQSVRDEARADALARMIDSVVDNRTSITAGPPDATTYVDRAAALVRTELATQPARQAGMLLAIGRAYNDLGAYQASLAALEEALLLRRASHGDDSSEVADVLEPLGQARAVLGRYDDAESTWRAAQAIRLRRGGDGDTSPGNVTVALGGLLHRLGRSPEAEQLLRAQLAAAGPGSGPLDDVTARARVALAGVLRDRGVAGEAEPLYRQVLSSITNTRTSTHPVAESRDAWTSPAARATEHARAQVGLAGLLIARGESDEPATLLIDATQSLRRVHGPDHPVLLEALRTQGRLRLAQRRLDEARAALAEAQRIHQQWIGVFTLDVPATRVLQAELALGEGRFADAVDSSRLVLDELARLELGDHPLTIEARAVLGESLTALGRRDEAVAVLTRAITAAEDSIAAGDPRIARLRTAAADATAPRRAR